MKKFTSSFKDRKYYNNNGFIVFKSVLSEKECEIFKKEAHRVCKKYNRNLKYL